MQALEHLRENCKAKVEVTTPHECRVKFINIMLVMFKSFTNLAVREDSKVFRQITIFISYLYTILGFNKHVYFSGS
jgi:hypothetical protein